MVAEASELKTVDYRDRPILFKAQEKKKKERKREGKRERQTTFTLSQRWGVGEAAGKRPRNFCCTEPHSLWGLGADTCEKWKTS